MATSSGARASSSVSERGFHFEPPFYWSTLPHETRLQLRYQKPEETDEECLQRHRVIRQEARQRFESTTPAGEQEIKALFVTWIEFDLDMDSEMTKGEDLLSDGKAFDSADTWTELVSAPSTVVSAPRFKSNLVEQFS